MMQIRVELNIGEKKVSENQTHRFTQLKTLPTLYTNYVPMHLGTHYF